MQQTLYKSIKITLISVYIIFVAGSFVRMTGSGMGCPDWPKCFGYYIPPTDENQLLWHEDTFYKKGVIIIFEERLLVSNNDFTSSEAFNLNNWSDYTKHDYAMFNAFHTWTEYINRLATVLSGFFFLAMTYFSIRYWRQNKTIGILALFGLFMMGFEAWLGKTVVDSELMPIKITTHMVAGLIIIASLIRMLFILDLEKNIFEKYKIPQKIKLLISVAAVLSLVQIVLGTQVRQFVDEQVKLYGFDNKKMSLYDPNIQFYIHRSFTILIILVNFSIYYWNKKQFNKLTQPLWIMGMLIVEALTGILMYYVDFPIGTQTVHLIAGAILFGLQLQLLFISNLKTAKKDIV